MGGRGHRCNGGLWHWSGPGSARSRRHRPGGGFGRWRGGGLSTACRQRGHHQCCQQNRYCRLKSPAHVSPCFASPPLPCIPKIPWTPEGLFLVIGAKKTTCPIRWRRSLNRTSPIVSPTLWAEKCRRYAPLLIPVALPTDSERRDQVSLTWGRFPRHRKLGAFHSAHGSDEEDGLGWSAST